MILLTGATGYVGGRLLPVLHEAGHRVRCFVRAGDALDRRVAQPAEIMRGDVLNADSLRPAVEGVDAAYYLIHSMGSAGDFAKKDRLAATGFAAAARAAGLGRIIYLGGLAHGQQLSPHLASRQEVGRILRGSGVLAIEFRASIIIGAGSISFEMVRALVDRLPVMIMPRWVRTLAQPIAIDDVIAYLVAALDVELADSKVFEIGGADRVSYLGLMKEYARGRRLRRIMIPVPLLTPGLSSLWLQLVTPLEAQVGRRLIEGVRNESVARDTQALSVFDIKPRGVAQAIAEAVEEKRLSST